MSPVEQYYATFAVGAIVMAILMLLVVRWTSREFDRKYGPRKK